MQNPKDLFVSRVLANRLIDPCAVMKGFIPEIVEMMTAQDQTVVLMLDQSKISDGFECLMISMRMADRAILVAWKVVATRGPIGFDVQELLLNAVLKMLPEDSTIFLAGDRFYGTSALIAWCQKNKWRYRLRLKSTLILTHEGGEITTGEAAKMGISSLENAQLSTTGVATHIGILHEEGYPEPWIIAMDAQPRRTKFWIMACGGALSACFPTLNQEASPLPKRSCAMEIALND